MAGLGMHPQTGKLAAAGFSVCRYVMAAKMAGSVNEKRWQPFFMPGFAKTADDSFVCLCMCRGCYMQLGRTV